jgi:hypothetical protein
MSNQLIENRRLAAGWSDLVRNDEKLPELEPDYCLSVDDGITLNRAKPRVGERKLSMAEYDRQNREARAVWHAALANYLRRRNARSVNAMVGKFGWFHLKLTRKEMIQVVRSAWGAGIIELEGDRDATGQPLHYSQSRWRLTEKGWRLRSPRGAGYSDVGRSLGDFARSALANAKDLFGLAGLFLAAGLGISLTENSLLGHALLILGAWFFIFVLTLSAYWDQRALTSCVLSWSRLSTYRPERVRCETAGFLRTPGPLAILLCASILALVGFWGCLSKAAKSWTGHSDGQWLVDGLWWTLSRFPGPIGERSHWRAWIANGHWVAVVIATLVAAFVILAWYFIKEWRGQLLRNGWCAEVNRRRLAEEEAGERVQLGCFGKLVDRVNGR